MGTVFGKNTTSASITVAGHKVYYIDSTDAELVEVEGQGGGGSTASDDVAGTISGMTLPTTHSYTDVSFDSLRYYVKGTLSNTGGVYRQAFGATYTWYYGTITWEDSSLGDLSSKIAVSDPDGRSYAQQSVLRIVFISGGSITGYHAYDTSDSSLITSQIVSYTYSNGVHSITFFNTNSWISGVYAGRIMFRYLDGVTTFNNLSAFDLVNVSDGSLLKATATDRYDMYNVWNGDIALHALYGSVETIRRNAFKYTLSGTPYWYVIDGEHDTWTDDLSEWGYSEVPVGPVLPTVTISNKWLVLGADAGATSGGNVTIAANATRAGCWWDGGSGSYIAAVYDSSVVYAIVRAAKTPWAVVARAGLPVENVGGAIGVRNQTGASITVHQAEYAYCDNLSATVVPVYDANNAAYNAFKYTLNDTDYYYVLDGTQTDWTDDLAGIGYSLNFTAYASTTKEPISMLSGTNTPLYDSSGNNIFPSGTPSLVKYYTSSSDTTGSTSASLSLTSGFYGLTLYNSSSSSITVQRIEYTVGGVVEMDVFFSSRGRSGASDTSVNPSGVYPVYDENGNAITYSAVSTYTAENVYNRAGQRPMYGTAVSFTSSGGQLAAVFDRYGNVFRISLKIES